MGDTAAIDSYRVLLSGGEGEIVEKKSRFIATIRKCETEEEAVAFIEEMKKKYWDARHNCSAFIIGSRGELTRCSDDGEPSGTAGRPMLEVLTGSGIRNIAVVVTRYFGGTLLGTGGLVRRACAQLCAALRQALSQEPYRAMEPEVLGPAPAPVVKLNNRYRYRITVVGQNEKPLRQLLAAYMKAFARRPEHRNMAVHTDCNLMD